MRFHSTLESVEAGEVSVLAVLETVLAVSVALYVAFRFDYTMHIAFGAIVAPFLMLRTTRSTLLGVRSLDRIATRGSEIILAAQTNRVVRSLPPGDGVHCTR